MGLLIFILILVLLVMAGVFGFILKVALGVALGLVLAVVLVASIVAWRVRRFLGLHRRRRGRRASRSSTIEVLDPRDRD